jgi:predicted nucleic acid-binding protein
MPATECYLDTSALIKLYVAEPFSDEVEQFLGGIDQPTVSSLTVLEWHCAMLRRHRAGHFPKRYLTAARKEFARHRAEGYFRLCALNDTLFTQAMGLLDETNPIPLRSLDAMHLAAARSLGKPAFATADKVLADAAKKIGLPVVRFFK